MVSLMLLLLLLLLLLVSLLLLPKGLKSKSCQQSVASPVFSKCLCTSGLDLNLAPCGFVMIVYHAALPCLGNTWKHHGDT